MAHWLRSVRTIGDEDVLDISDNDNSSVGKKDENKSLKQSMIEIINGLKEMMIANHIELEKQLTDSKSKLDAVVKHQNELSDKQTDMEGKLQKQFSQFLKAELKFGFKNQQTGYVTVKRYYERHKKIESLTSSVG